MQGLQLERPEARWRQFFVHLGDDFLFMARFLLLGATIAAAIQTFLPASLLTGVADLPVLSVVAMMGLAVLLSLCSESDAFVAASFVQFAPSAQLGFLVLGPMVDMKLLGRLRGDVPTRVRSDGGGGGVGDHARRRAVDRRGGRMSDVVALRSVPRADAAPPRSWSHARLAGALVLGSWAGLFWFLWLSGRVAFFLSSRTDWIVPVAAILLTAATVGRVVSARVRSPEPISARELLDRRPAGSAGRH